MREYEEQQRKKILYKEAHLPKDAPEIWKQYIKNLAEIAANHKWKER